MSYLEVNGYGDYTTGNYKLAVMSPGYIFLEDAQKENGTNITISYYMMADKQVVMLDQFYSEIYPDQNAINTIIAQANIDMDNFYE